MRHNIFKNLYGSSIFNMKPNTFMRLSSKSTINYSIKTLMSNIAHQNLLISNVTNNLGLTSLNIGNIKAFESSEDAISKDKITALEERIIEVFII